VDDLHSSLPKDLTTTALIYILKTTKGVIKAMAVIITAMLTVCSTSGGLAMLGVTPSGGGAAPGKLDAFMVVVIDDFGTGMKKRRSAVY
jgi:hypothetical protein